MIRSCRYLSKATIVVSAARLSWSSFRYILPLRSGDEITIWRPAERGAEWRCCRQWRLPVWWRSERSGALNAIMNLGFCNRACRSRQISAASHLPPSLALWPQYLANNSNALAIGTGWLPSITLVRHASVEGDILWWQERTFRYPNFTPTTGITASSHALCASSDMPSRGCSMQGRRLGQGIDRGTRSTLLTICCLRHGVAKKWVVCSVKVSDKQGSLMPEN